MNSIVALPILAATAVDAPALPSVSDRTSTIATLARAEQIIDALRTRHVADGWKLFEPAAEEMLGYFRRRVDGLPEDDFEFQLNVVEFFEAHGQPLDWVLSGDPVGMICRLAAARSDERGEPDQDLVNLVEQYLANDDEVGRLSGIVDELDGRRSLPIPDQLKFREEDAGLGIPAPTDFRGERSEAYADIRALRSERWTVASKIENPDGLSVSLQYVTPSPAARARADEIIAAYDKWEKARTRKPRGYGAAKRELEKALRLNDRMERQICTMRAKTTTGMIAKARCAQRVDFTAGINGDFSMSLAEDLFALSAQAASA